MIFAKHRCSRGRGEELEKSSFILLPTVNSQHSTKRAGTGAPPELSTVNCQLSTV
ncbi:MULTISPECIES: hypothetical protein [unclassified Microcoleus]|uniref:hypothetical protein n=1 Tax=unclassified Microcoleus TaxID=2642155 RepID=UPI0025D600DD|nr:MULTISPECIES: hypothetical protein [unclassified Microcoleus]